MKLSNNVLSDTASGQDDEIHTDGLLAGMRTFINTMGAHCNRKVRWKSDLTFCSHALDFALNHEKRGMPEISVRRLVELCATVMS